MGARLTKNLPIHVACQSGDPQAVQAVIDDAGDGARAFVDAYNWRGDTPLDIAAKRGDVAVAKVLLEAGAQVDFATGRVVTPLLYACDKGREDVLQVLLDAGANPSLATNDGITPLMNAS